MSKSHWLTCLFLSAALSGPSGLRAQGQPGTQSFQLRVVQGTSAVTLPSGGAVTFLGEAVNSPVTAQITVLYRGGGKGTVSRIELLGSQEFTTIIPATLPLDLNPGQDFTFSARFLPASIRPSSAQLTITVIDTPTSLAPGVPPGTPPTPVTSFLTLNLAGTVPDMAVVYLLQTDANPINLNDGGTLQFPSTPVSTTALATVAILNRGSGPLDLRTITLTQSGTEFQASGLPLLPGILDPGRDVRFNLRYSPRASGTHAAKLQITSAVQSVTASVQGVSTGPQFSYELIDGTTAFPLLSTQPYTLPDTSLGDIRSFVVRVRNNGDGDGQIAGISVLGVGFQVADLPFLPVVLAPASSVFFTLTFSPSQPGRVTGRLRIGNDTFELLGNGLGPRLAFAIVTGGGEVPVLPNGNINFPSTAIGGRASLDFSISNTGTTATVLTSIVTLSSFEFGLIGLPPLPANLGPGEKFVVTILFRPTAPGAVSSTMRVDNLVFNLSGFASSPPDLPGYRYDGASGVVDPLQQPAVGLILNTPYPAAISGTLNLAFNSDSFAVDPALQFITGGRSVTFTIPANCTRAIFSNNATQIRLQTGTVAGAIVLSPAFSLSTTGLNLTPSVPPSLTLTVPARPPSILNAEVTGGSQLTSNVITLFVTGMATNRSLTRMNLQFTPKSDTQVSVGGSQFALDISTTATLWYRSPNSQSFGSLFTATIPVTLQGLPLAMRPSDVLESVTITLVNELGTSSPASAPVR